MILLNDFALRLKKKSSASEGRNMAYAAKMVLLLHFFGADVSRVARPWGKIGFHVKTFSRGKPFSGGEEKTVTTAAGHIWASGVESRTHIHLYDSKQT